MGVAFELNSVGVWDMALYVFEVQHGCTHLETVRHDLDDDVVYDPVHGWVGADREDMKAIKEMAVRKRCRDCRKARPPAPDVEEDFMRVPPLLSRRWVHDSDTSAATSLL